MLLYLESIYKCGVEHTVLKSESNAEKYIFVLRYKQKLFEPTTVTKTELSELSEPEDHDPDAHHQDSRE